MKLLLLLEKEVKELRRQVEFSLHLFSKKHGISISKLWVFPIIITSNYLTTL